MRVKMAEIKQLDDLLSDEDYKKLLWSINVLVLYRNRVNKFLTPNYVYL